MRVSTLRAARWRLALSLAAIVSLGACADDAIAPKIPSAVESTSEQVSGDWLDVTVTNASGGTEVGSLRWAAAQIGPAGGAVHFDSSLAGATITLSGTVIPGGPVQIEGPPTKGITISGNYQVRVIQATTINGPVGLTNVTITKGYDPYYGSAVLASQLNLTNSTVYDNRGLGSAIRTEWGFSSLNSTVSGNLTGGAPAVEYGQRATVYLSNSTIAYNYGYGIGLYGPVDSNFSLYVQLNNSILANNAQNCLSSSGLRFEGWNVSSDWSCGVGMPIGDPQLLPLADNGGPTKTHALSYTSPAISAGRFPFFTSVDQRNVPRDAKPDLGAFEFNDFTKVTITIDTGVKVSSATGLANLTGTIKCTRNDSFRLALELHQDQKVNGQVVDVHAASDIPIACTTTAQAWSATMALTDGQAFQAGAARATAQTFNMPQWASPSSVAGAVKIKKVA